MDSGVTFTKCFWNGTTCIQVHKLNMHHPECVSMCVGHLKRMLCVFVIQLVIMYVISLFVLWALYVLWDVCHSPFVCLVFVWAACHSCRWDSSRSWWCWRKGLGLCLLSFIFSLCFKLVILFLKVNYFLRTCKAKSAWANIFYWQLELLFEFELFELRMW